MARKIRKFLLCLPFILCVSCGHRVMTNETFYGISTGTTTEDLVKVAGKPYSICRKCDCLEYEYIERIKNGTRTIQENHYYFVIKNNQVISRRVEYVNPPPYSINSYDLQTSSYDNEESLED